MSAALLIMSLLALTLAPKDGGTVTMYGLVIGINLLICLAYWPISHWIQRFNR